MQSAPCGVLAQRYALFPRLSLRPDGPRGFALHGSCRALAASMRLVLAFPLHSALRMPPTPPFAGPSNKKQTTKEKPKTVIAVAAGVLAPSGLAERGNDSRMSRKDAAKGGVEQERIDAGPSEA
ncbi:hypothetical protein HA50_01600 [Pantoea cypripedii]|uniref:Uncharacterized protein n=1 Tax=Pantoea cypripedii TaxID=55209 RepID=A0A1X1EQI5_PANCY|nr:hypothetical protein HA50_01600 [Pantoea cypripedii]